MAKTATKKSKPQICKAAESVAEVVQNTQLQVEHYFPCPIYLIERPDFLGIVNTVSEETLAIAHKERDLNEIYPVIMGGSFYADPRVAKFSEFVGGTAWNILAEQGYDMHDKVVQFTEMWTQEHHKHSAMDVHTHGYGSQIVGFYFLETPENCSKIVFHDPRAGKVQGSLPEQNMEAATQASRMINFTPKPGLLVFANSWLAHSFSRHAADQPIKFVHFNLNVAQDQNHSCKMPPPAEVV